MDKLISTNLLKETITKGAIVIDENITKCDTIHDILVYLLQKFEEAIFSTIDSQPTAYDVEAVVKKLEKISNGCGEIPLEEAIEIVRGEEE